MAQRATRNGATVSLPKYCNAEMLMLEFFAGTEVVIEPLRDTKRTKVTFSHTDGHMSEKTLDQLLDYVNANI